jgi:hypothetical protein
MEESMNGYGWAELYDLQTLLAAEAWRGGDGE